MDAYRIIEAYNWREGLENPSWREIYKSGQKGKGGVRGFDQTFLSKPLRGVHDFVKNSLTKVSGRVQGIYQNITKRETHTGYGIPFLSSFYF